MKHSIATGFGTVLVIVAAYIAIMAGLLGVMEAPLPHAPEAVQDSIQRVDDTATPDPYHGICYEDGSCDDGYCEPGALCDDTTAIKEG